MARQEPGAVHPLQGLVEQDCPGHLRSQLHHSGLPGHCAGHRGSDHCGPDSDGAVLLVLHSHAVLHAHGKNQASTREGDRIMRKLIFGLFIAILPALGLAAGAAVPLDPMEPDHTNKESLQRGAALFTNYCMGCHSMEYARYKRVSDDLEIPAELYEENLIFTGAKIGELMKISMGKDMAAGWFGAPPPALTLVTRVRGESWVYSYLRGFYKDVSRPLGVNNVVFDNVGMPHVMVEMQGLCAVEPRIGVSPSVEPLSGNINNADVCPEYAIEGSMSSEEFDAAMYDLTNFLSYMGDPVKVERERLGIFVLIFVAIFFIFAYLLNREYWKDVH